MLWTLSIMTKKFNHKHILSIDDLDRDDITKILDKANEFYNQNRSDNKKSNELVGKTIINLFFENSTRTLTSFEISAKRLGADCVNMSVSSSSIKKGETIIDTSTTLNAMRPDVIVIRHDNSGAVKLISRKVDCSVINAGDGLNEHPTQALLDALTIRNHFGCFDGLKIAIVGDILHSRVARSNIKLLNKFGVKITIVSPPTLGGENFEHLGCQYTHNMEDGIKDCDIIMMLRIQKERMSSSFFPSEKEYFKLYGLDKEKLKLAKPKVVVMHPGPINREVEITSSIVDDKSLNLIETQVEMGVAVRMACLYLISSREQ